MLSTLEQLLQKRQALGMPEVPPDEEAFFKQKMVEWQAVLSAPENHAYLRNSSK
jgi:hypothetical protein